MYEKYTISSFRLFFLDHILPRLIGFTRIIRLVLEYHAPMTNWFMYHHAHLNQAVPINIIISCPSIKLFICPFIRPYIYPSVRPKTCQSIWTKTYPSIRPKTYPSIRSYIYPSVWPKTCPSIRLYTCPSNRPNINSIISCPNSC